MASQHWDESAQAWISFVDGKDLNRDDVLDPALLDMAGDVKGLRTLDVGCGEGRFCRMLSELGANTVGLDPTTGLLEAARARHPEGTYIEGWAEDLPFDEASFDLVVSYVALCDVGDYRKAIQEMARVLKPGGRILYANLGPISSTTTNGWLKDEDGRPLHMPVDNYSFEWGAIVGWRGIEIVNYHRPLCDYMEAFLSCGLSLTKFQEPLPGPEAIRQSPKLAEYLRVRYFVAMEWRKP